MGKDLVCSWFRSKNVKRDFKQDAELSSNLQWINKDHTQHAAYPLSKSRDEVTKTERGREHLTTALTFPSCHKVPAPLRSALSPTAPALMREWWAWEVTQADYTEKHHEFLLSTNSLQTEELPQRITRAGDTEKKNPPFIGHFITHTHSIICQ